RRRYFDSLSQFALHLGKVEMGASIKRMGIKQYLCRTKVADVDDIEITIIEFRIGRDKHSTSEVTCICDAEIDGIEAVLIAFVHSDADRRILHANDLLKR